MFNQIMDGILLVSTTLFAATTGFLLYLYFNRNQNMDKIKLKVIEEWDRQKKKDFDESLEAETDKRVKEYKAEKQEEVDRIKQEIKDSLQEKEQELRSVLEEKANNQIERKKLELQAKMQEEEEKMRDRLLAFQERLENKEMSLSQKFDEIQESKEKLVNFKEELNLLKQSLEMDRLEIDKQKQGIEDERRRRLSEVAKIGYQEAREIILKEAKKDIGDGLFALQNKLHHQAEETANMKARELVSLAIQRCSSEVANEITITTVKLQSEEDKAKLIGKGGRNIQWLEKTLGVELIIDETPGLITISGFSSIRRHVAKKTIEKLIQDGRIHPATIEEMYEKAKSEIAQEIAEAGEQTVSDLGIYDFPPKLIRIIGRLKFRTSYGQNQLKHSIEMARLAGLLANSLNVHFPGSVKVDVDACIKGALLHDIGKALDEETPQKGNHIEIGEKLCDMFGLDWKVKKCISSHHTTGGDYHSYWDSAKGFCIEAAIVDACDNISGSRIGSRKETMEAYLQRLEGIEKVVNSIDNVDKSWVMSGGRQVWVFFKPEITSPEQVYEATQKIAEEIDRSVKTPQEIKVIGFREDRFEVMTR